MTHITFVDRNKYGLFLPNQNDLCLGSGHRCIEQVSPQHDIVLLQKRNDDDRILLSLALMDGRTVGKLKVLQHFLRIAQLTPIQKLDTRNRIIILCLHVGYDTDIAIRHIDPVYSLHNAIAHTEDPAATLHFLFQIVRRVDEFPYCLVQCIGRHGATLPKRR